MEQERRLDMVAQRLRTMRSEEDHLKRVVASTKERTQERLDTANRNMHIKKVAEETRQWADEELEQRRQTVTETRHMQRQAIQERRFAVLKERHDHFVAKKREEEEGREAIVAAREKKLEQARARTTSVRQRAEIAKQRNAVQAKALSESHRAQGQIAGTSEGAKVEATMQQLQRLAAEEERLLKSCLKLHKVHQSEVVRLKEKVPMFQIGLHPTGPLNLPSPIAPNNPMMSRRPMTGTPRSRPVTPRSYGNSVAGSPRTYTPGSFSSASPRRRSQPESMNATPRAELLGSSMQPAAGRTCALRKIESQRTRRSGDPCLRSHLRSFHSPTASLDLT